MSCVKLNRTELRRHYETDREGCLTALEGGIKAGEIRLAHAGTTLHDVFEAFTGNRVEDLFTAPANRKQRWESADFVGLVDFSIAAGLFLIDEANRGYKRPDFIAERLARKRTAASLKLAQKIPYFPLPSSDNNYRKLEGQPYNRVGAPSGYVESTPPEDNGFIIEVTRELLRDDKTGGGIADNCRRQGEGLGIAREIDLLKTYLGVQGSWKFGKNDAAPTTSYNTYATSSAPYVNSQSNTLSSWKSVDTAIQLFAAMTDPVTAQILGIPSNLTIVVPLAMMMKLRNILNATSVMEVDNQANSATVRAEFTNPLTNVPIPVTFTMLTNQYVKQATSSDTTWFIGDFVEAFVLNEGWDQEQMEQGQESNAYFESNILYRQRFSYNQKGYAYAPFRAQKCT